MKRPTKRGVNVDGKETVIITLSNGEECCLFRHDFDKLLKKGVSPNWARIDRGGYIVSNAKNDNGKLRLTYIGRLIMNAKPGETVRYLDKNPLNLLTTNLTKTS